MFRGRENELKAVRDALGGNCNILVYGPRRVGKTTLLKEAVEDFPGTCVWYECVKGSLEYNIELLAGAVAIALGKSYLANIRNLFDLFQMIAEGGKRIVVVIDEYPYLKESREGGVVDSYFQRIIDGKYPGLSLVLCGSFISMMRELLQKDNPLFGRFDLVMQVKPFDYFDASLFYGEAPVRKKIAMYSVFGGSPFVLERIDPSRSVEENIEDLLLQEYSPVRETVENTLLSEIGKMGLAREIVARIGNSRMKYNELEASLSVDARGSLDRELKRLIMMQVVEKNYPINRRDDKKKSFYELSDNLLRFYYTYVFPSRSNIVRLDPPSFFRLFVAESFGTFVSRRFEGIVREYFVRLMRTGRIADVTDIGTYWYDDRTTKRNGEFDCVMKSKDGDYRVYEAKYYKNPMRSAEVEEEARKIRAIMELRVGRIGFVSSSGYERPDDRYDEIDGAMLYSFD
ncbi:MAG: ATP-binding protein [Sphaerochaetaceae bacterium]|jgi:AAA+ ATPase superfamily predicted ATPase